MIIRAIYRYIKSKRNPSEPPSRDVVTPVAPASPLTDNQPPESKKLLVSKTLLWRLSLMVSLAIPVILETLDYTGKRLRGHCIRVDLPNLSSRCHRSNSSWCSF